MNNKGITLVALVVTIIIILILAGTAVYFGSDTIKKSKEQRFVTQLKQINEAVKLHSQDYEQLDLTELNEEYIVTINGNNHTYNYKLENESDYNKIGLQDIDIEDNIYINFIETEIYAENGFEGKHTLEDFGITYYKPSKVQSSDVDVDFNIVLEPQENSWKYIIPYEDITCNGNIQNGNLLYSEYIDGTEHAWKRVQKGQDGFELIITKPGIYELMFKDETGVESQIKQVYAYVKNGLKLYYDGTYNSKDEDGSISHNSSASTWADLSGNENDGVITGCTWNDNNLYFDGIDDEINNVPFEENSNDDITIDIAFSDNSSSYAGILNAQNEWSTFNFHTFTSNTYYIGENYTSGGSACRFESPNLNPSTINKNRIYKFTYTYKGNTKEAKLYINGDLISTKTYSHVPEYSEYFQIPVLGEKEIYKLNMYKIVLDENQIKKDYEIDKIRYNIQEE